MADSPYFEGAAFESAYFDTGETPSGRQHSIAIPAASLDETEADELIASGVL